MAAAFAVARHDAVDGVVALTVVGELDSVSGDILTTMTLDAVADDITDVVVDVGRVTGSTPSVWTRSCSARMPPGGRVAPIG